MKNIAILFLCSFLTLLCISCHEDQGLIYRCGNELQDVLCHATHSDDDERALSHISDFLKTLDYSNDFKDAIEEHESKLIELKDWLKSKECVENVDIICVSCIETYPLQSEVRIQFRTGEGEIEKVLDVVMDRPMVASRYHE